MIANLPEKQRRRTSSLSIKPKLATTAVGAEALRTNRNVPKAEQ